MEYPSRRRDCSCLTIALARLEIKKIVSSDDYHFVKIKFIFRK